MPKDVVVIGPPGTGKTEAAITVTRGWFKRGASPEQVAYLAFTKDAAKEAATRIFDEGMGWDINFKLPYFRTIHSLAYYGLHRQIPDARLMLPADMRLFSKWSGMEGAYSVPEWEDLSEIYANLENHGRTDWDKCLGAYTLSRISSRTVEELQAARTRISDLACRSFGFLEEDVYQAFVNKYELYKKANGLVDFTDMLEFALTQMLPLDTVQYVVIDECQDLAPLLFLIVERLFRNAKEIWYCGDEDQAIFTFAAADPQLFIDKVNGADHKVFLRQTHRFGAEIVDFSSKIIRRVRNRIEKDVIGFEGRTHSIRQTGDFKPIVTDMFILHRHVMGCQAVGQSYFEAGLPYRNERGKDPLGAYHRVEAFQALHALAGGNEVSMAAVARLIEDLMPSMVVSEAGEKVRLIVHGGKKRFEDYGKGLIDLQGLVQAKLLTTEGYEAIALKKFRIFKHPGDLEYYDKVLQNGYSLDGKNVPVITTQHASKGRQAPKVLIFSERGRKCAEEEDAEHRLAYVAATRTRGDLEICAERLVDWAEMPYEYPIDQEASIF